MCGATVGDSTSYDILWLDHHITKIWWYGDSDKNALDVLQSAKN